MSHWKCPICWERNCDCKYEDVMAALEKMEKAAKQAIHLNAVYQIPLDKAPEMPELDPLCEIVVLTSALEKLKKCPTCKNRRWSEHDQTWMSCEHPCIRSSFYMEYRYGQDERNPGDYWEIHVDFEKGTW